MLDRTTDAVAPVQISLRGGDLCDAFARTRHAICKEQTRYYLAGVYIHPAPDGIVTEWPRRASGSGRSLEPGPARKIVKGRMRHPKQQGTS